MTAMRSRAALTLTTTLEAAGWPICPAWAPARALHSSLSWRQEVGRLSPSNDNLPESKASLSTLDLASWKGPRACVSTMSAGEERQA